MGRRVGTGAAIERLGAAIERSGIARRLGVGLRPGTAPAGADDTQDGSHGLLRVYMNDQLAAGVLWREIARRAQRANAGTELGDALAGVAAAIAEDVATFEDIMDRLGIPRSRLKPAVALAGERVGRIKLNGRLLGYSPLSRFAELDILAMGIEGKVILWTNLGELAGLAARMPDVDFDGLVERARHQRAELEPFRLEAGRQALGGS